MEKTLCFKDGTRASLGEDGILTFYDRDEDGVQIGRRDYDAEGKLCLCWWEKVPYWATPVRYGQKKKVGRCPLPRRTHMFWDGTGHLCFADRLSIGGKCCPGMPVIGSLQHQELVLGYLYEDSDPRIPNSVRHVIIDTAGRESFCQCFDDKGLIYRQYTERHEEGRFVSARRTERQPDGSYRVFSCDEAGEHLSEEGLPQDIIDTWPMGYSYRSPDEGTPLPENWWMFPEYWLQQWTFGREER